MGSVFPCHTVQVQAGKAHWRGSDKTPLLDETLGNALMRVAAAWSDKIAVKTHEESLSYGQLDTLSNTLSRRLLDIGLKAGDRLVISLGNCSEFILTFLACAKIGVITVVLNPALTANQTIAAVEHVSAQSILTSTHVCPPYKGPCSNVGLVNELVEALQTSKSLTSVLVIDKTQQRLSEGARHRLTFFHDLLNGGTGDVSNTETLPCSVLNLQFTSGTTSAPKAVSLTHRGVLNNAIHIGERMGLSPSDTICCPFPLFHCSGLVVGLLATLLQGATVSFPSESFNPGIVLESIKRDSPTVLHGVPTMFEALMDLVASSQVEQLKNLRTGLIGGTSLSPALLAKIHEKLHLSRQISAFGMTELSPMATSTSQDDSVQRNLTTAGYAVPHSSIKIVDRNDPRVVLKTREKGEILVGGYLLMDGYWADDERTAQAVLVEPEGTPGPNRWMRTGDEGMIDESGYLTITGRLKDIIIRGGENIYPREIEDCLEQCDGVARAAVVGMPDKKLGEVTAAFIEVVPGANVDTKDSLESDELRSDRNEQLSKTIEIPHGQPLSANSLRSHVRDRLAKHLVPKYVFWVTEMPLTASGKIEKNILKKSLPTPG